MIKIVQLNVFKIRNYSKINFEISKFSLKNNNIKY